MTGSAYDSVPFGVADPDNPSAPWDSTSTTPTDEFARRVAERVDALRVEAEARRLMSETAVATDDLPKPARLDLFLAEADEDPTYRVAEMWPTGGNVVLAAQYKAGKSTAVGNLVRSLADGDDFLGRYATRPVSRIVLIDNELDPRMLRRWLRDHEIGNAARVEVLSLRGQLSSFDILDAGVRTQWARLLGAADVIVLDCLRPVLDALGLDENHDAGRFLVAFDALKTEAGIPEAVVVHHMGHQGQRSRGDSRILDWPDVTWKIVRESDEPASARYFSAFGRDVEIPESRLEYDPVNRSLSVAGGSRRENGALRAVDAIIAFVEDSPGCTGEDIRASVKGYARGTLTSARDRAVDLGRIERRARPGRGGGFSYFPATPPNSAPTPPGDVPNPARPSHRAGLELKIFDDEPRPVSQTAGDSA